MATRDLFPTGTPVEIQLLPLSASIGYTTRVLADVRVVDVLGVATTSGVMYPWARIESIRRLLPAAGDEEMAAKMPILASIVADQLEALRLGAAQNVAAR